MMYLLFWSLLPWINALSAEHICKLDGMFKSHFIDDKSVHCEKMSICHYNHNLNATEIRK